jgi:Fe-S-cluster-containing hydrogenase component 2
VYTVDEEECTGCGVCLEHCVSDAIEMQGHVAQIDQASCTSCGLCCEACPQGAIYEYEEIPALYEGGHGVAPYQASKSHLAVSRNPSVLARRERIAAALVLAPALSKFLFRLAGHISLRDSAGRRSTLDNYIKRHYTERAGRGRHRWRGGS